MKYITQDWTSTKDGYLFFVQRLQEMLFHYSDDIVKAPVHNTQTLLEEYVDTEKDVVKGSIKQYQLDIIALFSRRKQIEPNGDKTVTIRPSQCEQGKSFLKSMLYMIIDTCKQFYRFTSISFHYGIIQNQNLNPFRSGKGIKSGSNFSCKEQEKPAPVIGSFVKKTIIRIL